MAKSVQEFKIPIFFLLLVILPPMLSGWHAHPLVKGPVILAVPISFSEWPPGAHSVGIAWDGNSGWFVCHKKGLLKKKKKGLLFWWGMAALAVALEKGQWEPGPAVTSGHQ